MHLVHTLLLPQPSKSNRPCNWFIWCSCFSVQSLPRGRTESGTREGGDLSEGWRDLDGQKKSWKWWMKKRPLMMTMPGMRLRKWTNWLPRCASFPSLYKSRHRKAPLTEGYSEAKGLRTYTTNNNLKNATSWALMNKLVPALGFWVALYKFYS